MNCKILFLGEFRHQCFLDDLMGDIDYRQIKLSYYELIVKHVTPISFLISLRIFAINLLVDMPFGEFLKGSLVYGILKNRKFETVISTYDSNRPLFGFVSSLLTNVKFIGQYPALLRDKNLARIYPSNSIYYVMGEDDKEGLIKIGHDSNYIHLSSSIYVDLYKKSKYYNKDKEFDICLVSNVTHIWEFENELENELMLLTYVEKYAKNNKIKIAICLRPQPLGVIGQKKEYDFYSNLIKLHNVTVIPYNGCSYSSYNAISRSEVVIAHISTLGYESYNFKTKVMFFQPYSFMYKIPENFPFSVTSKKYINFKKCLDKVLRISEVEYEKMAANLHILYLTNGNNLTESLRSNY
jgi:hypothetical protein